MQGYKHDMYSLSLTLLFLLFLSFLLLATPICLLRPRLELLLALLLKYNNDIILKQ